VREFLDAHAKPGEPVFVLPLLSSYYLLLERPNPTGILEVRPRSRFSIVKQARKEREMQRLLDSGTRYVIVNRAWFATFKPPEYMRTVLRQRFHPIRRYGSVLILERGMDEPSLAITDVVLRLEADIVDPRDADVLRGLIHERPAWPLPHELLVRFLMLQRDMEGAVATLRIAHELDPLAIADLEIAASILLASGRTAEARDALREVHAVRASPRSRALWERLPESLRQ
jgi:hypothetical protein